MVAGVVESGVIGVDLGGTKLLAGAVDADLAIHHRTNRPIYGLSQDGLVQMIADAVQEIRTAVGGGIEAVGFGSSRFSPGSRRSSMPSSSRRQGRRGRER